MAKNSFEISTFTTGVIGSPSETDIPDDAAAFSVNINPIAEDGTLTGINEDTILTSGVGFNTQAQTTQTLTILRGAMVTTATVNVTGLAENSDDGLCKLTVSGHGLTVGDVIKFTKTGGGDGLNGYLRVNEITGVNDFTVNLPHADIASDLPTGSPLGTYIVHKDVSGATQDYKGAFITANTYNDSYEEKKYCFYFQQGGTDPEHGVDPDLDDFTSVSVEITTTNSAAEIATALNTKINAQDGLRSTVVSNVITVTPHLDIKADLCLIESTGDLDIPSQDGDYIDIDSSTITAAYTITGAGTPISVDDMSIINLDKKDYTLFGIDYTNDKIFKWEDIYNTNTNNILTEFKTNVLHDDKSSIIQRNRHLFIGLGGGESFKTQWIGKIKKTQLKQDLYNW